MILRVISETEGQAQENEANRTKRLRIKPVHEFDESSSTTDADNAVRTTDLEKKRENRRIKVSLHEIIV